MAEGKRKYLSDLKLNKITVKLSDKDMAKLNRDIEAANTTISKYVRELIQTGGGANLQYPTDRAKLIRQISGIATNFNQIAKQVNTQGNIYFLDLREIEADLKEIQRLLQEVLEVWRLQRY